MYRNIKSLCRTPGTNILLVVNYIYKQKANKVIEKAIRLVVTRGRVGGSRNSMKVVKRYKLPIIRKVCIRDGTYNMISIQLTLLYVICENC